jgi:hypothetical protein
MHTVNCDYPLNSVTARSADECDLAIDSTDENFNYYLSSNPIKDREAGTMIFKFWRPYKAPTCTEQLNLKLDTKIVPESD